MVQAAQRPGSEDKPDCIALRYRQDFGLLEGDLHCRAAGI